MQRKLLLWSCLALMFLGTWLSFGILINWWVGLLCTTMLFAVQFTYEKMLSKMTVQEEKDETIEM